MSAEPAQEPRFEFDVALSFAGEDREFVDAVARDLVAMEVRVFYDEFFANELWGKDLYQHFQKIYRDRARFCVIFVSKAYTAKVWPKHELRQAQDRALFESTEYILPVIIEDVEVPGLSRTTGYVDARDKHPMSLTAMILRKLDLFGTDPVYPDRLQRRKHERKHEGKRLVTYGGKPMAPSTPARIQRSQTLRHLVYTATARRIPYGEEFSPKYQMKKNCYDCGVRWGQLHITGCAREVCPLCGGQLLSCECPISEYSSQPFEAELFSGELQKNLVPSPFKPDRFGPEYELRRGRRRTRR